MNPRIEILPSDKINQYSWDQCVQKNSNGLIYTTSVYLNQLSEQWNGLVINDYETIMPLPWKKKTGVRYCYTPPFIQQLGITGDMTKETAKQIIATINAFVSYGDFQFNFSNSPLQQIIPVIPRTNLIIDLSNTYEIIRARYAHDTTENIRKAENKSLLYEKEYRTDGLILYQELYGKKMPHIKKEDYTRFKHLCNKLLAENQCFTRTVTHNHEVLSTAILLKDNKRIYNIMNATTQNGRQKEANYFLFDQLVREFAGSRVLLDFEGSDLPGVRNFYEKFGAAPQPYFYYHLNQLPWPLRLLKR